VFEDPAQAESLARLGLEVVALLGAEEHDPHLVADLEARGTAYLANTLRMRSDLEGAEEAMERAQAALERGTGDPLETGRVLDLKASLRKDQQRYAEALPLLDRAVALYRSVGEERRASRAEVTRAIVTRHADDPEAAIRLLRAAMGSLPDAGDPRLELCARHNLAVWLTDLDRPLEAWKAFRDAEPLYDRYPDLWTQHRRAWVEGRIQRGLGQLEAAEERLTWAQRGFVAQEIAYDAALVSLDLAAVYAEQGRNGDLKQLAAHMVPIFQSRDIHREALAALAWFRQEVEAETATAALVHHLLDFLQRARHDPALRWEGPEG
jgi:tetratricopeptide (TPR) repeat protein